MKGIITFYLSDFYKYALVIGRFAGLFVFLPGFGDTYVTGRIRALLTLSMAIAVTPAISASFPEYASDPFKLAVTLIGEVCVGFFLATLVRYIVAAADIAGTLIGFQIGLSNVFTLSAASNQQSSITSALFGGFIVLLLFVTDLHFIFIKTLLDSFALLKPGQLTEITMLSGELLKIIMETLAKSFWLGLQLSIPVILLSWLLTLAGGLVNRLMPQIQIFFLLQPVQLLLGFAVIFLTLEVFMRLIYGCLDDTFTSFISSNE